MTDEQIERLVMIAARGCDFVVEPLDNGWHGVEIIDGVPHERVGPFLTETTARVELALAVLDGAYQP